LFDAETVQDGSIIAEIGLAAAELQKRRFVTCMVQNISAKPTSAVAKIVFAQSRNVP
jgi:hypothetical protein